MKPKTNKFIMWLFISMMALQFIAAGIGKFMGAWTNMFIEWGYPISFMYLIGILEFAGVIGLFVSKFRKWAVLLLLVIMLGAMFTHLRNEEYSRLIHNFIIIGLLSALFYLDQRIKISAINI